MTTCNFLQVSDEAYRVSADGTQTAATGHLCKWPDQNPGRLVDAPLWLLKLVGPGLSVNPDVDCVRCPAFKSGEEVERHRKGTDT